VPFAHLCSLSFPKDYVESVDSDFSESESEAEAEEVQEDRPAKRAKPMYKDPRKQMRQQQQQKKKPKKAAAPKKPKVIEKSDRSVRSSTVAKTLHTKLQLEAQPKKPRKKRKKRVVRVLTQEEILEEAKETERQNVASLQAIIAWEEDERARRKRKAPVLDGPRVLYYSRDGKTILTFKDCDGYLPKCLSSIDGKTNKPVPKKPKPVIAKVTGEGATTKAQPKRKSSRRKGSSTRRRRKSDYGSSPVVTLRSRSSRKIKLKQSSDFAYE